MPEKQICKKCGKPLIEIVKAGVGVWFHQIEFGDCDLTPEPQILCRNCGKSREEHTDGDLCCYQLKNALRKDWTVFEPAPQAENKIKGE